ncbi:centromere protein W [Fundulus heteroclitus]|uniref:centromere protein W n=1 Tax=Fundulus heteroclitus TaxID=8078 RepID=UPI00079DD61A|nr:centromere protein W [Fundulus heteroclitus]
MPAKLTKLKRIIRGKAMGDVKIPAASEAMIELAVLLFLNSLAEEARVKAFEEKSATIRAQHVNAVTKKMLKRARG